VHDMVLVTRNVRDVSSTGLRVLDPSVSSAAGPRWAATCRSPAMTAVGASRPAPLSAGDGRAPGSGGR